MTRKETLSRASEVVNALVKHGLGYFVQTYGLKLHLPFHKKIKVYKKEDSIPIRLRKVMEELGGAYVKLGQLLSLRPDLVPHEYCVEFSKLLDKMPVFSYAKAKQVIEHEVGKNVFKDFDKTPIGSASIAQVHLAKLKNGKNVVVKIQRPNVKTQFESDVKIMYYFAHKVDKYMKNTVSPMAIVKEFERYTKNELNFMAEARNLARFHQMFKGTKKVVVPNVYLQHTTKKVLVMDRVEGIKLSEAYGSLSRKARQEVAKNIADAAFKQVLEEGFFHADLHPGNILVLPGNTIGLLDFGIVGILDKKLMRYSLDMLVALANKDSKVAVRTLLRVGTPTAETNLEEFAIEIDAIMHKWHGTDLGEERVTRMMHHMFNSCAKHHIRMPADLILLGKALVTVEGTCRQVSPAFNFVEYVRPQIIKLMKKENKPSALMKRFILRSREAGEALYDLPEQTLELVEKFKREPIKLDLDDVDIWHLGRDINYSSNRLAYAIVIAALLLFAAILVNIRPQVAGYSVFSVIAIGIAIILMLALITSVMRETTLRYGPHKKLER